MVVDINTEFVSTFYAPLQALYTHSFAGVKYPHMNAVIVYVKKRAQFIHIYACSKILLFANALLYAISVVKVWE